MSGAGAKARWYLETQIPELQQFVRRKIFSDAEVAQIVKKRSDFEHVINGRGEATAVDFARYAEFEMNLHALCQKRMKRRKVRDTKLYWSNRQVNFVMDRAVRKFPGDLRLWMQYIEYSRSRRAYRKVKELLTSCLRLHPTRSELWVYAAAFVLEEEADMQGARAYMQRGLRFCQRDKDIWLEYAKLEMIYVGKIAARRRILGLDGNGKRKRSQQDLEGEDVVTLADDGVTPEDINPQATPAGELDDIALRKMEKTPALNGAIPIAIFDAAMKAFPEEPALARKFFDLVSDSPQAACSHAILLHIVDHLERSSSSQLEPALCRIKVSLFGIEPESGEFPAALGTALQAISSSRERLPEYETEIAFTAVQLLLPHASGQSTDIDVQKVLDFSVQSLLKAIGLQETVGLTRARQKAGDGREARYLYRLGRKFWRNDYQYRALKSELNGDSMSLVDTEVGMPLVKEDQMVSVDGAEKSDQATPQDGSEGGT